MKIDIEYDGILGEIAQRIEDNLDEIIAAGAESVCENAKSMCPVDTGALRDSIKLERGERGAQILTDTPYAAFVEFGTSYMSPRPYLVPALIEKSDSVIAAMAQAINDI